jgi:hypothetical protein
MNQERESLRQDLYMRKLFIIKSIKRELKTRPINDCRYDERLEPKYDEFTKIETRLIDEKFANNPRSDCGDKTPETEKNRSVSR